MSSWTWFVIGNRDLLNNSVDRSRLLKVWGSLPLEILRKTRTTVATTTLQHRTDRSKLTPKVKLVKLVKSLSITHQLQYGYRLTVGLTWLGVLLDSSLSEESESVYGYGYYDSCLQDFTTYEIFYWMYMSVGFTAVIFNTSAPRPLSSWASSTSICTGTLAPVQMFVLLAHEDESLEVHYVEWEATSLQPSWCSVLCCS